MYIRKKDPEEDNFVDMLLCMNYMEKRGKMEARQYILDSKRMVGGLPEPTLPQSKYDQLGSRRKLLTEFLIKREEEREELRERKKQRQKEREELRELKKQRQKEKEELRELKKQKKELKKIKKEKKELKKIKREKKELRKIKREKKELRKIKREKKELKKKKRAETALNDQDEAPSKKLKLAEVEVDLENEKEMMNLEVVPSEDVEQQKQWVPACEPVQNLMAEGLKACTSQAEKKNENVEHSKDG